MGVTALLVAVVMYAGGIMRPDGIAQAFAKDAVVFIFGVLVFSRVVIGTGPGPAPGHAAAACRCAACRACSSCSCPCSP